jgi:membrane-associated phospholipid phosphatase
MIKKIPIIFLLSLNYICLNAQNLDVAIVKGLNPQDPHSGYLRATSASVYFIGAGTPVSLLVAGLISKDPALKAKSYEMFGAAVIELTTSGLLKISIARRRPAQKYPTEIFPYRELTGKSFPSGHTSLAFTTAASLSLQFKKWYVVVPAYLWAASVGYSRIYLGVHYPSDVLGGAAVGIGSAYLAHWLNKKIFLKKKR